MKELRLRITIDASPALWDLSDLRHAMAWMSLLASVGRTDFGNPFLGVTVAP